MLAEQTKLNGSDVLPAWDEKGEWVRWKDRIFPFVNFYMSHEVSARLLTSLELYPLQSQEFKRKMSSYMEEESEFLVRSLPGISTEAMTDAFYASIALKHYLLEENENDRIRAEQYLIHIRKLLHFDELFHEWESPREKGPRREQLKVPAQVEVLR